MHLAQGSDKDLRHCHRHPLNLHSSFSVPGPVRIQCFNYMVITSYNPHDMFLLTREVILSSPFYRWKYRDTNEQVTEPEFGCWPDCVPAAFSLIIYCCLSRYPYSRKYTTSVHWFFMASLHYHFKNSFLFFLIPNEILG